MSVVKQTQNAVSWRPGAPPNCRRPSIKATSSNACTRSGTSHTSPINCSPLTSTCFSKSSKKPADGPTGWGDDDDKRRQYLNDYRIKEGISLEADKIDKNPGRRSLAKMMLNSFWGKYGQQGNNSQVEGISELHRLYHLLDDDSRELQTLRIMNDEMIEVIH